MSNTWLKAKKVVESVVTEDHRKSAINYIKLAIKDCERRVIKSKRVAKKISSCLTHYVDDYGIEHDDLTSMYLDFTRPPGPE